MTYIVISPSGGGGGGPVNVGDLVPITDGSFPSSGQIFETLTASTNAFTSTNVGASGAFGYAISLLVPAGAWEIYGTAELLENAAVITDIVLAGISDSATGSGMAVFEQSRSAPFLNGNPISVLTPIKRVSITTPTTYYLNTQFSYSSGTPQHRGQIWAKRFT